MDVHLSLFNGFMLGLERRKFSPFWASFDEEGYAIFFHCGLDVTIGFIRIRFGTFFSDEEMVEILKE